MLFEVLVLVWLRASWTQEDDTWTNNHPFFVIESSVEFPNGLLSLHTPTKIMIKADIREFYSQTHHRHVLETGKENW